MSTQMADPRMAVRDGAFRYEGLPLWFAYTFRDQLPREWHRASEGRSTQWSAEVWTGDGCWAGRILRRSGTRRKRAFWDSLTLNEADGVWTFYGFTSAGNAMRLLEVWLLARRDPATWRAEEQVIPAGDYYTVQVEDEALFLATFPARFAGARVL